MNPYHQLVSELAGLFVKGRSLPLGEIPPFSKPSLKPDAPVALIFSPHPDDECVIGGLALRLMREAGMRVINIAVTLGSNRARQAGRWQELSNACGWIGFGLESTTPNGLEKINPTTRSQSPEQWAAAVKIIVNILARHQPRVILFPHQLDSNTTHSGTHFLVMDALRQMPPNFKCHLVETEFWGPLPTPNLMVELRTEDVGDLLSALSFHVEEVKRNPYHLRLPAWMQDNVRRGAELVGGQGGAAPDFLFATLYRARLWKNGALEETYQGGRQIGVKDSVGAVFSKID